MLVFGIRLDMQFVPRDDHDEDRDRLHFGESAANASAGTAAECHECLSGPILQESFRTPGVRVLPVPRCIPHSISDVSRVHFKKRTMIVHGQYVDEDLRAFRDSHIYRVSGTVVGC